MDDYTPERYGGHKHRDAKALLAVVFTAGLLAALLTASSCNGPNRTLFQSNFNATPAGQTPAPNQPVGTVSWFGQNLEVFVENPPYGATGTDHWVLIGRPYQQPPYNTAPLAGVICRLSQTVGQGKYNFAASIFMPQPVPRQPPNVASISFLSQTDLNPINGESGPNWDGFVHFDLLQNNTVRINDAVNTNVTFPRMQPFLLTVNLDTTKATASSPAAFATIKTLGAGTSGTAPPYAIPLKAPSSGPPPFVDASQFAAVVLWMGAPWTGYFEATAIAVTNNT